MAVQDAATHAEFLYALHLLPAGRFPFRRWRWELWSGATLLCCGWRLSEEHAERALRAAASSYTHRRAGLRALHPDRAQPRGGRFWPGSVVELDCGAVSCTLHPRVAAA